MADLEELDARCCAAGREVRVLRALSWPEGEAESFLSSVAAGSPRPPSPREVAPADTASIAELDAVVAGCSRESPLEAFVAETAESYGRAARMLGAVGTPAFTELSCALYGHPRDALPGAQVSHVEAAKRLLENTARLAEAGVVNESDICITAETVGEELSGAFARFFGDAAPEVAIDPQLASKAAAGATRVRLRGRTCFSDLDIAQLREHEGFIHSATALNGRLQPTLSTLGLGAPRTTATQEGLATVAELITHSMDISRLRRIALRTVAIDMALEGADFVQVFEYFRSEGQSESESVHSAMRVFRGGDPKGRVAFTKDVVYLSGLIEVHTFLRKAIEQSQPHLVARLFAGRLTLSDVTALGSAFESGEVAAARYVPKWATDLPRLGAYLAFNALVDLVDLSRIELGAVRAESAGPGTR